MEREEKSVSPDQRHAAARSNEKQKSGSKQPHEPKEIIMIGAAVPKFLRPQTTVSNERSNPRPEIKLKFAPAAASLIIEPPDPQDGQSLANDSYNPNQPRVPSGQSTGGQWTGGATSPSTIALSGQNSLLADQLQNPGDPSQSSDAATDLRTGQMTATSGGTLDDLEKASQILDEGYAKGVSDINKMTGISVEERNAGFKSLKEKYDDARDALDDRIASIEQTARDIAFAYGGNASDYYKLLDDQDPKLQELISILGYLDAIGSKDQLLLQLRQLQGRGLPPASDPHMLRTLLVTALGILGGGGMKAKALEELEKMGLRDVELYGASFNSGRKHLEDAGFVWVKTTETGRREFENPKTGVQVFFDSGKALTGDQKPHWHI